MSALPEEFMERLKQIIPPSDWQTVRNSFGIEKPLVVRVNTQLTQPSEIKQTFSQLNIPFKQLDWKPDALIVPPTYRAGVINSEPYQQGLLYNQNLSSQLAPMVLNPQLGEEILDMCAAPGGKTAQIACMMKETGRIAAVEKVKARFFKLKAILNALQHTTVHTYLTDAVGLWRKTPERFDRILLDAPCSSESRFQVGKPDSFDYWKLKKIKESSRKQRKLVYSAVQCLKPGGTLVYSTCSFAPEENEAVIDYILKKFPHQLELQPISLPVNNVQAGLIEWQGKNFDASLANYSIRILPNHLMNGFYICKLKKTGSTLNTAA